MGAPPHDRHAHHPRHRGGGLPLGPRHRDDTAPREGRRRVRDRPAPAARGRRAGKPGVPRLLHGDPRPHPPRLRRRSA
ncbi:hypothetical protein ACFPRL_09720 [Pseudoclavibacter helvolus]